MPESQNQHKSFTERKLDSPTYAKAIYDNIAESPDELAFKRGDILTVIEQDTDGLTGWWLCKLRGRQLLLMSEINVVVCLRAL
uniref:Uncharacterized protein n=1 Tax=Phlebotomus papatasi TaxID=29031 RepID=A0A1B0D495_PHLPP